MGSCYIRAPGRRRVHGAVLSLSRFVRGAHDVKAGLGIAQFNRKTAAAILGSPLFQNDLLTDLKPGEAGGGLRL